MDNALVIGVGAPEGVGAAVCRRAAREGLRVFPVARSKERLDAVAADITAAGGAAIPIVADCTVPEDMTRIFETIATEGGAPPRFLLYNAGNNFPAELADITNEKFESDWRVCAFGALLLAREVVARIPPNGGGTVVFTGATASIRARPPFISFASAKAAERAIAHGLARQLSKEGVHVAHVVIDGVINGNQVNSRFPEAKEFLGEDGMLSVDAIADAMWMLHRQPRTAWTLELDLRPYKETF